MSKLQIIEAKYHQNGVTGRGFTIVRFKDWAHRHRTLTAVLFDGDDNNMCSAVFEESNLQNRYNGADYYAADLKALLESKERQDELQLFDYSRCTNKH
jgi:hypothetical protein